MKDFISAEEAFLYYYNEIHKNGQVFGDTKALFNVGFYINNPTARIIDIPWRKWSKDYAQLEWEWYCGGDRSAVAISKRAKIWEKCMDKYGNVNSNYGWHILQEYKGVSQMEYVIEELKNNPNSRRASMSIYDAKNRDNFENDTPCTYAINFMIISGKLCMSVMMRSNDLWYGFCNDQYCFSMIQEEVAEVLNIEVGWYYHFANNLHLYNNKLNKIK